MACGHYNSVGITSIVDPGLSPHEFRGYQNVYRKGTLTVRSALCVVAWGYLKTPAEESKVKERLEAMGVSTGLGDHWLRLDAVKMMPDGGVGDRTALMYEPYRDEPDNRGQEIVEAAKLREYILWCHERGWSVDCHTCGDRMQDIVVEAYAEAYRRQPWARIRHRIHHGYLPSARALALMQEHRIAALTQPDFIYGMGESYVPALGLSRASRLKPHRTYLDRGIPLAFSSDSPVYEVHPFLGLYAAVARKTIKGTQFDEGESVTREKALIAYTRSAAPITGEKAIKGSLEPGKLADLVVLDRDYLTCPEDEIRDIRPVATMVDGRWVYGGF